MRRARIASFMDRLIRRVKPLVITAMMGFVTCYCIIILSTDIADPSDDESAVKMGHHNRKPIKDNDVDGKNKDIVISEVETKRHKRSFLETIDSTNISYNRSVFGQNYTLFQNRTSEYDFPFLINGSSICNQDELAFLIIMVPSVHSHIDVRSAIRNTWGRAAKPGLWPKVGSLNKVIKLVFLFGTSKTSLGSSIVKEESKLFGDVVQGNFVDSYFNLTYKSIMGVRWVAEFCPGAKFILKADEDVFVHVKNLIDFLDKRPIKPSGVIYGHALMNSEVLREGRWKVKQAAFPLRTYPTYTCGNTYVISGNIAAQIYYTAGLLPYLNIEDVFLTGIVREFLSAELQDVIGFTHWYETRPKSCSFKNNIRISATKVDKDLQEEIWEGLKRNIVDCYKPVKTKHAVARRPEGRSSTLVRDDHIFLNKSSGKFYVL